MGERVNTKAAAAYVGLSEALLNQLRGQGGGPPYYKLRARVFYDLSDLDAWLEARRIDSTNPRLTGS